MKLMTHTTAKKLGIWLIALSSGLVTGFAGATDSDNWRSGDGELAWKTGAENLCWRSVSWTPATAVPGCDGALLQAPTPALIPSIAPDVMNKKPSSSGKGIAGSANANGPAGVAVVPENGRKPEVLDKVTYAADTFFAFGKAILRQEGKRKLDNLLDKIKDLKLEVIIAVGHTDSVGSNAVNDRLSIARAQAVQSYLVHKGIAKELIKIDGQGKHHPIASNASSEGRAKNRRAEVELIALPR